MNSAANTLKGLYIPAVIGLAWLAGSHFSLWNSYIIPPPSEVAAAFWQISCDGSLAKHLLTSVYRVFVGFCAAFLLAFPLAVLLGMFSRLSAYLDITLEALRHIHKPPAGRRRGRPLAWPAAWL